MELAEISVSYGMEKLNRSLWNFTSQAADPIIVTETERDSILGAHWDLTTINYS